MADGRARAPHLETTPSESDEPSDEEEHDPDNSSHAGDVLTMILHDLNKTDVKKKQNSGTFYDDTSEQMDESAADDREEYVGLEKGDTLRYERREESISVVENTESEKQEEVKDPYIVSWDRPNDPANPKNWSQKKIRTNVGVVSTFTVLTYVKRFSAGMPFCQLLTMVIGAVSARTVNRRPTEGS